LKHHRICPDEYPTDIERHRAWLKTFHSFIICDETNSQHFLFKILLNLNKTVGQAPFKPGSQSYKNLLV